MLLLGASAASLKNFEVNEAQRHQAQGKAGHYAGEEHKQAGNSRKDEPLKGAERDVISFEDDVVGRRPHDCTSSGYGVPQQHFLVSLVGGCWCGATRAK